MAAAAVAPLLPLAPSFEFKPDTGRRGRTPPKEAARLKRLLLERCSGGAAAELAALHGCMIKTGLITDDHLTGALLAALSAAPSSGSLAYAEQVLDGVSRPNAFMWNALIRAHSTMLRSDSPPPLPNDHTFPFLLRACAAEELRQVHAHVVKTGFASDVYTANSLIHAYAKSNGAGGPACARQVFDRMPRRDVVSWNSMLSGYVSAGKIGAARELFDAMPAAARNLVSWTTVIHGCAESGLPREALALFRGMQLAGLRPDAASLAAALSGCAQLGALEQGQWIGAYVEREGIAVDPTLVCALVDMYSKCGEVDAAIRLNVCVWTAMIHGLGVNGRGLEALDLFEEMPQRGLHPNRITLTAALTACGHSGLVAEGGPFSGGWKDHYGCMVHLLGRAGLLEEARKMAQRAAQSGGSGGNVIVWGALLSASRAHGNWEMGKEVGQILLQLDSGHGGRYVNLAKVLAGEGRWPEAAAVRSLMKERGVRKLPGCSAICVDGGVDEFVAGDRSHPRSCEIYAELERMMARLKEHGYAPATGGAALLGLEEQDEKAAALCSHSEKLAMAFGLISTEPGSGLRIVKNLRVCEDCHAAAKLVSKLYRRRIIMRDRTRFHLFADGTCSCGDYW
ncbi:unnamed protein product [Spirodela intermedia]|uniref:DYW domain-containing protein n=1 Tax=Spirodela intermedia TaxID=51605 RepID=A0A7I8J5C8_SPIIN|nr:unnamed protein product [Spirodela intermedia]CAA6665240.1 unnamed protein product [Spirodela intermedia]